MSSSAASSRENSTFAFVTRALRALPLQRFIARRNSAEATLVDDDPWKEPGGINDEMERAFIAREQRRR